MVKQISHGFNKKETNIKGDRPKKRRSQEAAPRAHRSPLEEREYDLSWVAPGVEEPNDWWCEPLRSRLSVPKEVPFLPVGFFVFVALISYLFLISGSIVRQMWDSTHHIDACKSAGKSFKLCNSCFSNQSKRLQRSSSFLWKENGGYTCRLKQCVYCLVFMRRHSPKCGFRKWFLKLCLGGMKKELAFVESTWFFADWWLQISKSFCSRLLYT